MLWLTLPVLVEQMLHMLVGFTDLWLTGNFLPGEAYVAAMTLMIYALWLVGNVFGVVALGSTAMVARFVGAARSRDGQSRDESIDSHRPRLGTAADGRSPCRSPDTFPLVMGLKGTAAAAAERYLTIEFCVLPAVMVERVAIACLRGAGDTVSGLVTMAIVNVINMGCSYALCTGLGPLPELGWTGIALGTAIGHCCGAAILLVAAGRRPRRVSLAARGHAARLRSHSPHPADRHPGRHRRGSGQHLPDDLLADRAVAGRRGGCRAWRGDPSGSTRLHAGRRVSGFGRDDGRAILGCPRSGSRRYSVIQTCIVAAAVMVVAGVIFYVAATPLAGFFLTGQNQAVVPLAAHLLRIVAYAMGPLAIVLVLVGALRGAGDTRWPLALNLLGIVFFRVPLAYYLTRREMYLPLLGWTIHGANLGVVGAWYAMVLDIVVRCILLMLRFRHDAWQRIEV